MVNWKKYHFVKPEPPFFTHCFINYSHLFLSSCIVQCVNKFNYCWFLLCLTVGLIQVILSLSLVNEESRLWNLVVHSENHIILYSIVKVEILSPNLHLFVNLSYCLLWVCEDCSKASIRQCSTANSCPKLKSEIIYPINPTTDIRHSDRKTDFDDF